VETLHKFLLMFLAIGIFVGIVAVVLFIVGRFSGRQADRAVATAFIGPAVIMVSVGLIYPGLRTLLESFRDDVGHSFVGLSNYKVIFTSSDDLIVLRNTAIWVLVAPFVATAVGLIYAVLVDKARGEAFAKALVFLPMAISFVGASIIWGFVYDSSKTGKVQVGILNQIVVWLGGSPHQWLLNSPANTLFLVVIMIWIQAGFSMTILSAAIKAIPDEIIEAAQLDGVGGVKLFRTITVPSIRPALIVVLTTIAIGTLKAFDIVYTTTGGAFKTSVVANEFVKQSFVQGQQGHGAALAVLLFVLVIPIVVYNVRQLREADSR
jgi:alpha-glucoside transport system permease protein